MSKKRIYDFAHIHQPNLFAYEDVARGVEKIQTLGEGAGWIRRNTQRRH